MSRVYMCEHPLAGTPYYVEEMGIRVYSPEELCFCLFENAELFNDEFVCRELLVWLSRECGMKEFAVRFAKKNAGFGRLLTFTTDLFEYTGFYTPDRLRQLRLLMENDPSMGKAQKYKRRVDYARSKGYLKTALRGYRKLVNSLPSSEKAVIADCYHNMGYICARLFYFGLAAKYYEKAYSYSGDAESLRQLLLAKRFELGQEEYIAFVSAGGSEYYRESLLVEEEVLKAENSWRKECGETVSSDDTLRKIYEQYETMSREKQ